MKSSGTSNQRKSKILLDKQTASMQTKVLSLLVQDVLGSKRLPMLIIDSPKTVKSRHSLTARGPVFWVFQCLENVSYALTDSMNLNFKALEKFLKENENKTIFVFGFTYMIWLYFYKTL